MATEPLVSWLAIEIAPGWTLEEHADHLTLMPASGDSLLRLSSFSVEETGTDAARWIEVATHFNRLRGRSGVAVRCGDFTGEATKFAAGGKWFRGWVLRAHEIPLDVTYSCAEADAGRDDPTVDAMLQSLKLRGVRRPTAR
jgi:hypothetical protein